MSNLNPTDDYTFSGRVRFRQAPTFPNDAIPSAAIDGPIDAVKLEGEHNFTLSQTGDVVAATEYLRVVFGATGVVIAMEAAITEAVATGPDRTVTVDLLKSSGGGAFASILAAPLVIQQHIDAPRTRQRRLLEPRSGGRRHPQAHGVGGRRRGRSGPGSCLLGDHS